MLLVLVRVGEPQAIAGALTGAGTVTASLTVGASLAAVLTATDTLTANLTAGATTAHVLSRGASVRRRGRR